MVILTNILNYAKKVERKLPRKYKRQGILDSLHVYVKAGSGGSGLPRYGGIGGAGGNVYVVSQEKLDLETVKSKTRNVKLKAESGSESTARGIIGVRGSDLNINIPVGITVYDENNVKLGEVNSENEKLLVAKGGIGGCESTGYCGIKGESRHIILDLKLISDVGLIGFPNAGKSTFLNTVSRAKPKIANYPFTTIKPKIGLMKYNDYREITVADLPGLIEGAHANKGMGHRFLKHIERTKLLLFIVDIQGFQLSHKHVHRSCLETVLLLNKEIELYKPDLLERPAIIIVNKMDTNSANKIYDEIKPKLNNLSEIVSEFEEIMQPEKVIQFDDIIATSLIANDRNQVNEIKDRIRNIIDKYEEKKLFPEDTNSAEDDLRIKLKQQSQRYTPIMI